MCVSVCTASFNHSHQRAWLLSWPPDCMQGGFHSYPFPLLNIDLKSFASRNGEMIQIHRLFPNAMVPLFFNIGIIFRGITLCAGGGWQSGLFPFVLSGFSSFPPSGKKKEEENVGRVCFCFSPEVEAQVR